MLNREPVTCKAEITIKDNKKSFDEYMPSDITIEDYPRELIKTKNPQFKFPLGI